MGPFPLASTLGVTGDSGAVDPPGFPMRTLSRAQCLSLLGTARVGRVGVTIGALPVILPVNFTVDDNLIVFRTVSGTKLDAAMHRAVAAFEADDHAADGSWGWSVLVRGYTHDVRGSSRIDHVAPLAWAFPHGEANHVVAIEVTMVSGRRFGVPPTHVEASS